jgi:hypothetical protein
MWRSAGAILNNGHATTHDPTINPVEYTKVIAPTASNTNPPATSLQRRPLSAVGPASL